MRGALRTDDRFGAAITGLAAVGAAGAGNVVAGAPGTVAGAALVVAWLVAPPIFVVALGQVLFAAVLPDGASLAAVALVEAPLAAIVLADVTDWREPLRTFVVGVVSLVAFAAVALAGLGWLARTWHVAALLVCVAGVASYALHRYTVVTFELTDEF